jgi:hypothetical protein
VTRAVLVAPRNSDAATSRAVLQAAALGYTLVGVVDPDRHVEALQLVVDDLADVILALAPLPNVRLLGDEPVAPGERRTRMLPRARGEHLLDPGRIPSQRRPQPVVT